ARRGILLEGGVMRSRTTLPAIVLMALGGLLGYAAASGRAKMAQAQVGESAPTARALRPTAVSEKQGSCCQNVALAQMLTLATNNERVDAAAQASGKKPNIVIIWGDDVGQSDISAYSMGLMGFRTPNIDRVAKEGVIFTDYYAEQSCTAGRSSFIT